MNYKELLEFYHNKRVLVTGHTGFKGSWLTKILLKAGAEVIGYSLASPTDPSLFNLISLDKNPHFIQVTGDVRNLELLKRTVAETKPDILFHLAAQPIVRDSYCNPVDTYSINVMGTVNVCECVRLSAIPKSKGGLNEIGGGWDGIKYGNGDIAKTNHSMDTTRIRIPSHVANWLHIHIKNHFFLKKGILII